MTLRRLTALLASVLAAAVFAPALLLPGWCEVRNYPPPDNADLHQLSSWARESTSKDAMFFFPDAGHSLAPGVFRANALRALYVDWKAGGQVNFLKNFAHEWGARWENSQADHFTFPDIDRYRALGIDYIVLAPAHRIAAREPAFENARYVVYRTAT